MDEITFKVALVADISLFVAKITFVVEGIIQEHVTTSSVAKITYVAAEITLKVAILWTNFVWLVQTLYKTVVQKYLGKEFVLGFFLICPYYI